MEGDGSRTCGLLCIFASVSCVELGSRFESAAPAIRHLAFAPGICIALQLSPHVSIYILHLSFGGAGREMKRLGKIR